MKNLILHKEGEASFITWIKKRIKLNLNFIGLFQGATGIGKTWNALSVSESIDPDFIVEQVVFSPKELMDVINAEWFKTKKWKIIIFDEPQITISNRSWQSLTNRMMNYLLTTFRHQNIILLFASPFYDFLDNQSMKLLHTVFECQGVDRKTNLSKVVPKILQYNSYLKKMYLHPLYVIKNKKAEPLRYWNIKKPSQELINKYELKKLMFTNKLNEDILLQLSELDKENKETKNNDNNTKKPLTEMQEKVMKLLINHNQTETAKELKISISAVNQHYSLALKKGYKVEDLKNTENP